MSSWSRFLTWYQHQLRSRPLPTQSATSTILWGAGDLLAQEIECQMSHRLHEEEREPATLRGSPQHNADAHQVGDPSDPPAPAADSIDYQRVLSTALFGTVFVGPAGHFWYQGLESFVRRRLLLRPGSLRFLSAKVALDTFVFGPLHLAAFFSYTGLVAGHSLDRIRRDVARDLLPAFITEATVWPAIQAVNFRAVPVQHQLLVVNAFCVLDSAWLSWLKYQHDAEWKRWLARTLMGQGGEDGGKEGGDQGVPVGEGGDRAQSRSPV